MIILKCKDKIIKWFNNVSHFPLEFTDTDHYFLLASLLYHNSDNQNNTHFPRCLHIMLPTSPCWDTQDFIPQEGLHSLDCLSLLSFETLEPVHGT